MQENNNEAQALPEVDETAEDIITFYDPLNIPIDNLSESEYDKEQFKRGLSDSSYQAGIFTGLINAGIGYRDAIDYIFTKMSFDMNIKVAEINGKATIEAAKNSTVAIEKQQI
jgi:hypothetical protein